jgi:hypothetical protein
MAKYLNLSVNKLKFKKISNITLQAVSFRMIAPTQKGSRFKKREVMRQLVDDLRVNPAFHLCPLYEDRPAQKNKNHAGRSCGDCVQL